MLLGDPHREIGDLNFSRRHRSFGRSIGRRGSFGAGQLAPQIRRQVAKAERAAPDLPRRREDDEVSQFPGIAVERQKRQSVDQLGIEVP